HLAGMVRELIDGLKLTLGGRSSPEEQAGGGTRSDDLPAEGQEPQSTARPGQGNGAPGRGRLPKLPDPWEARELVARAGRGEVLRLTLGEERWQLVERMQAVMSLIEGHAEHTMDAVGAEVLPSLPALRAAMNRRRRDRGLAWRVLERLLGLELK